MLLLMMMTMMMMWVGIGELVITIVVVFILSKSYLKLKRRRESRRGRVPQGTLGWPLVGETLEFVSCAYSPRPESFMEKRRLFDAKAFVPCYPKSLTELMGNPPSYPSMATSKGEFTGLSARF
uniref:Uncharacterized protein n=1 Tax=Ananas comosus var. bracteatus TaxID=296719 RepID=A0A6V7QQ78_ANACO